MRRTRRFFWHITLVGAMLLGPLPVQGEDANGQAQESTPQEGGTTFKPWTAPLKHPGPVSISKMGTEDFFRGNEDKEPPPPPPPPPPADSDGDGVTDDQDDCPGTKRGVPVNRRGCPTDSDRDGVPDFRDDCPNTPPGTKVDTRGCPLDSDQDGVPDDRDQCPNTPHGVPVDSTGCPMDSDRDGVTDDKDECPNTPLGASVDHRGCWVLRDIYFDTGRSELKVGTLSTLDEVAQVMSKNSNLRVDIQGHTDHVGTDRYNQRLSEKRAEAVRTYLIREKGIDETRLTASGFGKTKPIADNGTPEGRAMNRRVELTPTP